MHTPDHTPRDGLHSRLSGLPGLDAARARIAQWTAIRPAPGQPAPVHAMLIGLRRFDAVNLAYGQPAGDAALAEVGHRIAAFAADELDSPRLLAHAGGGQLLLAANEPCSRGGWRLVAEQLADALSQPVIVPAGVLRLSPRIALLRALEAESVGSMLDRLAQALGKAKAQQGRRIAWGEGEAMPPGRSLARLEADLLGAIDRDEIVVLFQPQFGLPEDRLIGAEALARWNHPALGRIGAGALFAIAERTDQVAPLSRHIATRALEIACEWPDHLRLSLNVTPADLAMASYAGQMLDLVRDSGFAPHRLTLEITEHALLYDVQHAAGLMADLAAQGIRIALDDFGAGFCNFRYLKVLPIHYLKLDRAMVDGITADKRDLAVLRAIIAMAGALDIEVIAEGIENEAQHACIAAEGCAFYQGFLRAAPMGAEMFAKLAQIPA